MADMKQQVRLTREDDTGLWITHAWLSLKESKNNRIQRFGNQWKIADKYSIHDMEEDKKFKEPKKVKGG